MGRASTTALPPEDSSVDVRGRTRTPTRTWQEVSAEPGCVVVVMFLLVAEILPCFSSLVLWHTPRKKCHQLRAERSATEGRLCSRRVSLRANECNRSSKVQRSQVSLLSAFSARSLGIIGFATASKNRTSTCLDYSKFLTTRPVDVDNGSDRMAGGCCCCCYAAEAKLERIWFITSRFSISRGRTNAQT